MPAMAVGFFELMFDNDTRQREHITAARDQSVDLANDIHAVNTQVGALRKQVHDMSMVINVLVRILEEAGQLDLKVLRYRVEAEVENERRAARSIPHEVTPEETPPPATPTVYSRCGTTVPTHQTVITAAGTVCDRCGAGR